MQLLVTKQPAPRAHPVVRFPGMQIPVRHGRGQAGRVVGYPAGGSQPWEGAVHRMWAEIPCHPKQNGEKPRLPEPNVNNHLIFKTIAIP
jgi:hypothetical protein